MPGKELARMLNSDDLRDVDRTLLDYLNEGRVTPVYCTNRLVEEGQEYSRGYVRDRLARFVDHDHAQNLMDTGLYELVEDPRDE
ncbi:hypothetical protein [Halocatena halophila]|uniref:hypothetical protein n=1 Tax=Halocatena halophila TaxID=2814576 RepID=UPI002ED52BDA